MRGATTPHSVRWLDLRDLGAVGGRLDCACDPAQHPAEDHLMDRAEEIPVDEPDVSGGVEHRGLAQVRSTVLIRVYLELQPQPPWDLHLGHEAQDAVSLEA